MDALVLGAGASGLCFALLAARRGLNVTVLEHGPGAARKLRASGGGRCNLTNMAAGPNDYFSDNPRFCASALARFTPRDALDLFGSLGLTFEEKAPGQMFCVQGAGRLAQVLEEACASAGARIVPDCAVRTVSGTGPFQAETSRGLFSAPCLVVALGGPSWPGLGASSFAFDLARQYGLPVVEPRPALVPLVLAGAEAALCRDLAGLTVPRVRAACGRRGFEGGLVFTHRGLSGPAIMEASCVWRPGQDLVIDFLPGQDAAALLAEQRASRAQVKTVLGRLVPGRLAQALAADLATRPLDQLGGKDLARLAARVHSWRVRPAGDEGLAKAEVTAGGVDTRALSSKTMESRDVAGLYFVGECLDVTGRLGGFNLQWAWASAAAAAAAVPAAP